MKVEILYVAGCPAYFETLRRIRQALAAEGVAANIRDVLVADSRVAEHLRFPGSPTIRIDGSDITNGAENPQISLSCRIYAGSDASPVPPIETIRRAIAEARRKSRS
ncbi:MAG TPA: hypothetical protein VMF66_14870 [Candidatus Acidoferrum sp.]|nr:hypothetical protein [Candidatus Acidoferrum sp.]